MRLFEAIIEANHLMFEEGNRVCHPCRCALLSFAFVATFSAQAAITEAWVHRYNGPVNSNDVAEAVAIDSAGNVIVTGASHNGTNEDFYTAKYAAASGELLWERRYNGPSNGLDHADALALDGSGNVFVTGGSDNGTQQHFYTAKYAAADGALLWEKRLTAGFGRGRAVAVDSNGNAIVTGFFADVAHSDFYTVKYSAANGVVLWERRYNGPANHHDEVRALAIDGTGNVVVTGTSYNTPSNTTFYTAKYAAANGALLWEKRYDGSTENYGLAVAIDGSGNVAVTGIAVSGGNADRYTARYAAGDGALLWQTRYNGPGNGDDDGRAVAVDSGGNIIVTGLSENTNANSDYCTAKYAAADGALLWEKRYDGPTDSTDVGNAVAVDASDNVVVSGVSSDPSNNHDYYTAKYAATNGELLWEKRYNGPANGADLVLTSGSLALGPDGFVAITGYSDGNFGPETTWDCATILYREPLSPVAIAVVPDGIRLRFVGRAAHAYDVQHAGSVNGLWDTIATRTAPKDGIIEYTNTMPLPRMGFYRIAEAR